MKKVSAIGIIAVLVASLFIGLVPSSVASPDWIIDGDTVYTDDANVYLSATPHTITSWGWVYFNLTTKAYTGDIDVVWGFNLPTVKPTKAELYAPHWDNTTTNHEQFFYNVSSFSSSPDTCDFGNSYNPLHYNVTYEICDSWNETTFECEAYKITSSIVCFDSYTNESNDYTAYWHTNHPNWVLWKDITSSLTKVNYNHGGMNTWYPLKNIPVVAGKSYQVRAWVDISPSLDKTEAKYWWAIKPSSETIPQAISNNHFYALDPWIDDPGWSYKKVINITGQSGAGTYYQVNLSIGGSSGGDFHLEGHCTDFPNDTVVTDDDGTTKLPFWIENSSADPIQMWVNVSDDLNTSQNVCIYYGKSGESSARDIGNTFPFGDDFPGDTLNATKWPSTNDNPSVSGGQVHLDNDDRIRGSTAFGFGYAIESRAKANEQDVIFVALLQDILDESDAVDLANSDATSPNDFDELRCRCVKASASDDDFRTFSDFRNTWYTYRIKRISETHTIFEQGVNSYTDDNVHVPTIDLYPVFGAWDSSQESQLDVDWVFVRKCQAAEPAFNSAGSEESAPPTVTLLSQTPSVLYQNSTGNLNITYGITHSSSGLNNTSVSFIYTVYNPIDDTYNHSLRVPSNNRSALESVTGEYILRADNRNYTLNFEDNATITRGNVYEWGGGDENTTRLTIEPVNSTYTLVYWNGTIRDTASIDSWYLNREEQQNATMTNLDIHKSSRPCIKIWDLETIYGHDDYLFNFYLDTDFSGATPTKPILLYYLNSSYDPEGSVNPEDSPYGFFVTSHNATTWIDYLYELRNSSYIKAFSINQSAIVDAGINTTNTAWVCFNTETSQSKPYSLNMTNDPTSTNRTFGECNVTWVGNNAPLAENLYSINAFGSDRHRGHQFKHQLYIADNAGTWANSTINTTDIEKAYFPPTKPAFAYFYYQDEKDIGMNHTYSGTFDIGIAPASDPDGGDVPHNLTLHYGNRTFIAVINNTFNDTMRDNTYINISFDSSSYYTSIDNFTLQVNATDDEGVSIITWLRVNFTLNPPTLTIGGDQNIKEDWGQDFSSNFSANVTGQNAKNVWMNFTHNNFTNTSLGWLNVSTDEWVNQSHNMGSPIANISVNITLNSTTADTTNGTASFYYEITKRNNTATMDSAATQSVATDVDFFVNASIIEEYGDAFYGAADLLEDGAVILTNSSVIDYVNFTHNESVASVYNYTIRFYNLTHYNNATTPTYSNVTVSVPDFIPQDPINLQNTTSASGFWIKHTWDAGAGNITNSYNVSVNGTDYNGTTNTYFNNTGLSAHSWSNITVFAYNSSGNGSLSSGSVSENVQLPNNPVSITNCSNRGAIETQTVYVDINSSDADGDTPTYSCNRTDLFANFSTSTGVGNWTTTTLDNGTYYIDFGVSDGYGSTDNCTMIITIVEGTPTAPTNLQYSLSNGNQTIDWTWTNGQNTNSIDAILNGSAIGTITSPHQYTNSTLPRWENISIRGYNTTTSEYSTWTNDTAYIETYVATYNISGYVNDTLGASIENVYITNNITADDDYTNATGFYNLTGLLDNAYLITATKMCYATNTTVVTISGSDVINANITMEARKDLPIITDWYNNITNDSQSIIYINTTTCIYFNVTVTQEIDTFYWYKTENLLSNETYDNITTCWNDTSETGVFKVYGENANGTTNTVVWYVGENMSFITEQNLLLLEENEMIGMSVLLGVLIVVGILFFLIGIIQPNSVLTLLGSITFFITMALPIPMLPDYPYFGIALTSILLLFGLIGIIMTFYQFFTTYNSDKGYHKWDNYFNNQ